MRRAARIDDNQRAIVAALRAAGAEIVSTAAMGEGFPDLLALRGSQIFMLEVKDGSKPPSRQRLTPHQVNFKKRWPVHVVTCEEEALRAIGL